MLNKRWLKAWTLFKTILQYDKAKSSVFTHGKQRKGFRGSKRLRKLSAAVFLFVVFVFFIQKISTVTFPKLTPVRVAVLSTYLPEFEKVADLTHSLLHKGIEKSLFCSYAASMDVFEGSFLSFCPVRVNVVQLVHGSKGRETDPLPEVSHQIDKEASEEFLGAVEHINSKFNILSIEYREGHFGGPNDDENLFALLPKIIIPIHVSIHSIPASLSALQFAQISQILKYADEISVFGFDLCETIELKFKDDTPCQYIPPGYETQPPPPHILHKYVSHFHGRRVLLGAGAISPQKGYEAVIRAVQEVALDVPNLLYVIAGDLYQPVDLGHLVKLKSLVKSLNLEEKVVFVESGHLGRDELQALIHTAEIVVDPEMDQAAAFSRLLVSAMGYGKPAVTSATAFASKFLCAHLSTVHGTGIMHHGDPPPCWTVPFSQSGQLETKDFVSALSFLLSFEKVRKSTGRSARKKVQGLSWPEIGNKRTQLYLELSRRTFRKDMSPKSPLKKWAVEEVQEKALSLLLSKPEISGNPFQSSVSVENIPLLFDQCLQGKFPPSALASYVNRATALFSVEGQSVQLAAWHPQGDNTRMRVLGKNGFYNEASGEFAARNGLVSAHGVLSKGRFEHSVPADGAMFGWGVVYSSEVFYRYDGVDYNYYLDRQSETAKHKAIIDEDFAIFQIEDALRGTGKDIGWFHVEYVMYRGTMNVDIRHFITAFGNKKLEGVEVNSKIYFEDRPHPRVSMFFAETADRRVRTETVSEKSGLMFDMEKNGAEVWHSWSESTGDFPLFHHSINASSLRYVSYGTFAKSSEVSYAHYRYALGDLTSTTVRIEEKRWMLAHSPPEHFSSHAQVLEFSSLKGFDVSGIPAKKVLSILDRIKADPVYEVTLHKFKSWLLNS